MITMQLAIEFQLETLLRTSHSKLDLEVLYNPRFHEEPLTFIEMSIPQKKLFVVKKVL